MDQCGICIHAQCFGDVVGPSWYSYILRILHHGLLECLFGWVFHSDSVYESDGNLWWWWWWWWLYYRETFDIEILLSQIIIFCTACSVDRAFGISFRKIYSIYRSYHIFIFYTIFWVLDTLRFVFICSVRRDIDIYIHRFTSYIPEWVLPFRAYPVKYIKLYFISSYISLEFFTFVIITYHSLY